MKILSKEEYARTIYYAIGAEDKDGNEIFATLMVNWNNDNSVASYEIEILDDTKIKLTQEQIDELEELAINYLE